MSPKLLNLVKELGKIWGVQGSMFGDEWIKADEYFELNFLDHCIFALEYKTAL
jgi:hypothetical protein